MSEAAGDTLSIAKKKRYRVQAYNIVGGRV